MKILLPAFLLALLPSCAGLIVPAAAAAVGIWTYHEYSEESGDIILANNPSEVFQAAESVARARATEVEVARASMRIQCTVDQATVRINVLMIPENSDVCQLKVSAWELVRGRADLAKEIAEDIKARL